MAYPIIDFVVCCVFAVTMFLILWEVISNVSAHYHLIASIRMSLFLLLVWFLISLPRLWELQKVLYGV